MSVTYTDIIQLLESSKPEHKLYVAVFYKTERYEWLPVDKTEYLRQLKEISTPDKVFYPCLFEVENDGEMFIHPRVENGLVIQRPNPQTLEELQERERLRLNIEP